MWSEKSKNIDLEVSILHNQVNPHSSIDGVSCWLKSKRKYYFYTIFPSCPFPDEWPVSKRALGYENLFFLPKNFFDKIKPLGLIENS